MFKKLFKNVFNNETKTVTAAAVIIGFFSLISRLLGVLRDRVLAGQFGAGAELDMYYAAFRLPDLLFNLIILGALSAGFIPVFTRYLKRDKVLNLVMLGKSHQAWKLVNILVNLSFFGLVIIGIILSIFAQPLIKLITPGFSAEQIVITTNLTRIMFLSPIFLGLSGIFGGVLQSWRRFFIYSLAPIMYNIGIIFGALFFVGWWGIYGLAWGVVLGAFLHFLIQLPAVFTLGYRYQVLLNWKFKGIKEIFRIMIPRTLSLAITQLNLFVMTIIASTLAAGSIAIFNLANNLQSFPLGIFGVSFAIAVFPTLSELTKEKSKFISNFSSALRQMMFFIIPASAILIILRAQIVRAILGAGLFDWQDTILTMETLSFFAFGLFAQAALTLLVRAFFAYHDSKTPFFASLISAILNIVLAIVLAKRFEVAGLALAFSISSVFNAIILWLILRYKVGGLDEFKISISLAKIGSATLMMSLMIQAMKYLLEPIFGTQTFLGVASQGALAAASGFLVYLGVCFYLRSPEAFVFVESVKKRFFKKYQPTEVVEE